MKVANKKSFYTKALALVIFLGFLMFVSNSAEAIPLAPSGLSAQPLSPSRISVSWNDNSSDETDFLLYRALNANMFNPVIIPLAPNSTSRTDSSLSADTTYYYKVYACNTDGCVGSGVANATTLSPPPPTTGSSSYGVTYDPSTKRLGGFAWAADLGGWLAFNSDSCTDPAAPCTVRADVLNLAPQVTNVAVNIDPAIWCADHGTSGGPNDIAFRVNWAYTDPESDAQSFAEVRFTDQANPTDELVATSSGIEASLRYADPLGWVQTGNYADPGYLDPDKTYRVAVRVNDGNSFSGWLESADVVQTPPYYYPLVDFDWTPAPAPLRTPITFNDKTIDRSGGSSPESEWSRAWQFQNGSPGSSLTAGPTVRFSVLPSDATLAITDPAGVCSYTQSVTTDGNPPPLKRRQFREK